MVRPSTKVSGSSQSFKLEVSSIRLKTAQPGTSSILRKSPTVQFTLAFTLGGGG